MNQILNITNDCFEVFLENTKSYEGDEFLAKVLNFLKNSGMDVFLKGFDKYKRPIVEINGILHTTDKSFALGLSQRFICAKHDIVFEDDTDRYNRLIEYLGWTYKNYFK